jgi:hypothetical protein
MVCWRFTSAWWCWHDTPPLPSHPCFPGQWPAMGNSPAACVAGAGPQTVQEACGALAEALPCLSSGQGTLPDVWRAAAGP